MGENKNGMEIKVTDYSDKSGSKIDFYSTSPKDNSDHDAIHIKIDYDNGKWSSVDNVNGGKETNSGSCYLTSACMRHFKEKFDDNCYELRVLRWFRDKFVSQEDIIHYYETAPIIVDEIDNAPKSEMVYEYIYDNVIDACVEAIENGDYDFAYSRYKSSILAFEKTFTKPILEERLVKSLIHI